MAGLRGVSSFAGLIGPVCIRTDSRNAPFLPLLLEPVAFRESLFWDSNGTKGAGKFQGELRFVERLPRARHGSRSVACVVGTCSSQHPEQTGTVPAVPIQEGTQG